MFAVEVRVLPFIDFIKSNRKRLRSTFSKALLIFRGAIDGIWSDFFGFSHVQPVRKSGLRETGLWLALDVLVEGVWMCSVL